MMNFPQIRPIKEIRTLYLRKSNNKALAASVIGCVAVGVTIPVTTPWYAIVTAGALIGFGCRQLFGDKRYHITFEEDDNGS